MNVDQLNDACHCEDVQVLELLVFSSHTFCPYRFIMSSHLQWMVIRNCSSFLLKRNGQTYSTVCLFLNFYFISLTWQNDL